MKDIDDIYLPKSSDNEELEELSRKKFAPLFDEERFLIKQEFIDNGIDCRIELRKNKSKTGFAVNFQLKSKFIGTANKDGSFSKAIETKNIEYKLNNGQPGFYGFYIKSEDKFYYTHLNEVIRDLFKKDPDWEEQETHTIRFTKVLDQNAVSEIYNIGISHGKMLRELNYRGAMMRSVSDVENENKIVIDYQKSVTDDNEIRKLIEDYGLYAINKGDWKEIIRLHKMLTSDLLTSKYNLILGMAHYHNGELFKSLSHLKAAKVSVNDLSENLKDYLHYYFYTVRFSVGLLNKQEYREKLLGIENNRNISLHLEIDEAREEYLNSTKQEEEKFEHFKSRIDGIINDNEASSNVKLMAKCEMISIWGNKINISYTSGVAYINGLEAAASHPIVELRIELANRLLKENNEWSDFCTQVKRESVKESNYLSLYIALLNEANVRYKFDVFTNYLRVQMPLDGANQVSEEERELKMNELLEEVKLCVNFFDEIGHATNKVGALSIQYEVLKYLKKDDEASELLDEIEKIVDSIDSPGVLRKFELLKNQGTTHEMFSAYIKGVTTRIEDTTNEAEGLIKKMEQFDRIEEKLERSYPEFYQIELFPMGNFSFPKNQLQLVLEKIGFTKEAKEVLAFQLEYGIIPVCNIFYSPVPEIGYMNGHQAHNGIEGLKRIYSIRKWFHDNKFLRISR